MLGTFFRSFKTLLNIIEKFKNSRGQQAVKGKPQSHDFKLALDILQLMMKCKKKLDGFYRSLFRKLVEGDQSF